MRVTADGGSKSCYVFAFVDFDGLLMSILDSMILVREVMVTDVF